MLALSSSAPGVHHGEDGTGHHHSMGATYHFVTLGEAEQEEVWPAEVRLRPAGYAVTVFVQTLFERKLVGRPGLEPGTTGLKVRS